MFYWLWRERDETLIREQRKTRMTIMAIRDELMDAIADLSDKIDRHFGGDESKCQARVDAVQAVADAKYDHDMGEAKAKIDELRAKFGDFEPSNQ